MSGIKEWTLLARDLMKCGHDIFATARVPFTKKGYRDEQFLAMTLLARTMSNFKSAMLLVDNRRIIESRVPVRCCLENYLLGGWHFRRRRKVRARDVTR